LTATGRSGIGGTENTGSSANGGVTGAIYRARRNFEL